MSRLTWAWCLVLASMLALACSTVDVNVDYDTSFDFAPYTSYGWLKPPEDIGDLRADNPLLHKRLQAEIDRQLAARGYRYESASPDFLVAYHLGLRQGYDVSAVSHGYRYPVADTVMVREYEEGTLAIDVVDTRSDTLVWRGLGTKRLLRNPTPEQTTENVRDVVSQVLAAFPPGP